MNKRELCCMSRNEIHPHIYSSIGTTTLSLYFSYFGIIFYSGVCIIVSIVGIALFMLIPLKWEFGCVCKLFEKIETERHHKHYNRKWRPKSLSKISKGKTLEDFKPSVKRRILRKEDCQEKERKNEWMKVNEGRGRNAWIKYG